MSKPNDNELRRAAHNAALGEAEQMLAVVRKHVDAVIAGSSAGRIRWHQIHGPNKLPEAHVFQGDGDDYSVCLVRMGTMFRGTLVAKTASPVVVILPPRMVEVLWHFASVQWN